MKWIEFKQHVETQLEELGIPLDKANILSIYHDDMLPDIEVSQDDDDHERVFIRGINRVIKKASKKETPK